MTPEQIQSLREKFFKECDPLEWMDRKNANAIFYWWIDEVEELQERNSDVASVHQDSIVPWDAPVDTSNSIEQYEPVHEWFELSYAQYLTVPRSVLQSMPTEWQKRFVDCLNELDESIDWRPKEGRYWVSLKDGKGRYLTDPFMDYERGRRKIPLNTREQAMEDDFQVPTSVKLNNDPD